METKKKIFRGYKKQILDIVDIVGLSNINKSTIIDWTTGEKISLESEYERIMNSEKYEPKKNIRFTIPGY